MDQVPGRGERVVWGGGLGRCVMCFLRCFLRCFCVYSLADKLRWTGTSVSGGVRTRSVYLNCHGRARPNTE